MPAYEVATIKPWDGKGFTMPFQAYIQIAFGIPPNRMGSVIGPKWIESARYAIQGKPPESVREALRTMTPQEGAKVMRGMMQSLLADRFGLKAHYEMREMAEYQLVVAKGGSKLKESADQTKRWILPGASVIKGNAMPVGVLAEALEQVPDIGGRPVIDTTGLSGSYDLLLRWTPMDAAPAVGGSGTASLADAEGSLFTALQEQMGLKLVSAKGPVQVVVIDHIERPTAN